LTPHDPLSRFCFVCCVACVSIVSLLRIALSLFTLSKITVLSRCRGRSPRRLCISYPGFTSLKYAVFSLLFFSCQILQRLGEANPVILNGPSNFGACFAAKPSTALDRWCSLAQTVSPFFGFQGRLRRF